MTTTITPLLDEAKNTHRLAEALTPDQCKEVWSHLDEYCEEASNISVSGFSEVLEAKLNVNDYLLACLVMDLSPEQMTNDNPDFERLTIDEQEAFLNECDCSLEALRV